MLDRLTRFADRVMRLGDCLRRSKNPSGVPEGFLLLWIIR